MFYLVSMSHHFASYNSTSFALKLHIPSNGDNNIDSATRPQCVQSLITHTITDKAAYLNEATN